MTPSASKVDISSVFRLTDPSDNNNSCIVLAVDSFWSGDEVPESTEMRELVGATEIITSPLHPYKIDRGADVPVLVVAQNEQVHLSLG